MTNTFTWTWQRLYVDIYDRTHACARAEHICVYGMGRRTMSCSTLTSLWKQQTCVFSVLSLPWVLGRVLLCSSREEPSTGSRIALLFFVWAPTVVCLHPTGDSLRRIPAISEQAPDAFSFCSSHCVLADVSNIVLSLRNQPQLSTNLSSVNSDRCYADNISRKEPSLFSTETLRDSTLICSLIIWLAVSDGGQRMHHTRNSNATTSRWQSPCWS